MPYLKMLRGPHKNTVYTLTDEIITIGRGRRNDIIIQDNEVSRDHCRLVRILDQYELHDLSSSNGTFVAGKRIDSAGYLLDSQTMIELGDAITFEYSLDESFDESFHDFELQEGMQSPDPTELGLYLVIDVLEKGEQSIYPLNPMTNTLGRGRDNDIVIQEAVMSRHHLRITLLDNQYFIEDLNSLNGSQINGKKLTSPVPLRVNDMVNIGKAIQIYCTNNPRRQTKYTTQSIRNKQSQNMQTKELKTKELQTKQLDTKVLVDRTTTEVTIDVLKTAIRKPLQPGQLKDHIFINYSFTDYDTVIETLFKYTKRNNLPFWYGNHLPLNSNLWKDSFDQALLECVLLVIVVSPDALADKHVQKSLTYFVNRKKPIVLLDYKSVELLPLAASDLPRVPYEVAKPGESIKNLLREIRNQLR